MRNYSIIYLLFLDFKNLKLQIYDSSTAKILVESRKFDYIDIRDPMFELWKDLLIDTKELEVYDISLTEILQTESIKTNSLIIDIEEDEFQDITLNISIRFVSLFCLF